MPFISSEDVATMRKAIRAALPDFKISVTGHHHSSVNVRIMSGPIPPAEHVNVFSYKEHLKDRPDAVEVIDKILAEIFKVKEERIIVHDSDYGAVPNFYYDVNFGQWDRPYVCTTKEGN